MGGIFSTPAPPPPAEDRALTEQIDRQREDRAEAERRNAARLRNIRGRAVRRPLLFDSYAGVPPAGPDRRSETLG